MWDATWHVERSAAAMMYALVVRGADGRDTTRVVAPKDARFVPRGTVESVRASASSPRTITVEIT